MAARACPMCGEPVPADVETCPHCQEPLRRKKSSGEGDATGGVIPYKNVPALAGYYCAVFSLIPCFGLVLGPAAFILGILGLRAASQNPAVKGQVHAWIGIVLGGLCGLANWAVILLGVAGAAFKA